jgi:hypothetical protein
MYLNELHFEQLQRDRQRELDSRARKPQHRLDSPSIRRSVGQSIMRIGAWLAAEPQPRLARSR